LCNSMLLRSPVASTLPENPVNGRLADLERLRDVAGPHALRLQFSHPCLIYRGRPTLVNASGLRLGDALQLPHAAQVDRELGEHAEEALAGGRAGVDRTGRSP
jgi:hypothetical protein